jgi:hypothetical protein
MPNKEKIQKSNTHFPNHFLIPILSLTHYLISNLFQSLSISLNILRNFIHSSMTYLLHGAEAFQHILCIRNKQNNAKVSVKMILEKWNIFPQNHFIHSVRWEICHIHLGEKFTHFLIFSFLLHITPIPPSFLLLSTSSSSIIQCHKSYSLKDMK